MRIPCPRARGKYITCSLCPQTQIGLQQCTLNHACMFSCDSGERWTAIIVGIENAQSTAMKLPYHITVLKRYIPTTRGAFQECQVHLGLHPFTSSVAPQRKLQDCLYHLIWYITAIVEWEHRYQRFEAWSGPNAVQFAFYTHADGSIGFGCAKRRTEQVVSQSIQIWHHMVIEEPPRAPLVHYKASATVKVHKSVLRYLYG